MLSPVYSPPVATLALVACFNYCPILVANIRFRKHGSGGGGVRPSVSQAAAAQGNMFAARSFFNELHKFAGRSACTYIQAAAAFTNCREDGGDTGMRRRRRLHSGIFAGKGTRYQDGKLDQTAEYRANYGVQFRGFVLKRRRQLESRLLCSKNGELKVNPAANCGQMFEVLEQ
jgi:hypothetical protein